MPRTETPPLRALKKRVHRPQLAADAPSANNTPIEQVELEVNGQGIVSFVNNERNPFSWTVTDAGDMEGLRLEVAKDKVVIYERREGSWEIAHEYPDPASGQARDEQGRPSTDQPPEAIGLEAGTCQYWFSLDCHNRRIRYGKGEMRLLTTLVDHPLASDQPDAYAWIHDAKLVQLEPPKECDVEVWRDPVTTEPPLRVVPTNQITMDDIALNNAAVSANLTPACQKLYDNVSGANFRLDTADFPEFVDAIQASIRDPSGWCHKKLEEKQGDFNTAATGHGGARAAESVGGEIEDKETYLRITMGVNQGDSPGIPYVMEIWPGGHYSPIHNHGGANAIIRVLSGEITARLFPRLSPDLQEQERFAEKVLRKDDVTWIAPGLNQIHQLYNQNENGPACITIQCYMYGEDDTMHYEYFDYIAAGEIKQFTPDTDMDFLEFKRLMKAEWENRSRTLPP